jgi:RNA polymerase sigma factor (sigma-70 family)
MTDHEQDTTTGTPATDLDGANDNVRPIRRGADVRHDEGDGEAEVKQPFESIVEQHGPAVLRVCRLLLASHDAEDAWSKTFIAALRAYPDLPADANVEAWLVTIAQRKAIDILRATSRRALPVDELPEATPLNHNSNGIPGTADHDLWHAVRALPDKQRQAVAYHYVAGLPYAEIAQILGGTTDAARRAAADGIKNLRKNYPGAHTEGAPS